VYLRVAAKTGAFKGEDLESEYFKTYTDDGEAKKKGWYANHSSKEFVLNVKAGKHWPHCGAQDNQANGLCHAVPVVALYAGDTAALLRAVSEAVRVTQNTTEAVAFAQAGARLLEKFLLFDIDGRAAIQQVIAELRDDKRVCPTEHDGKLADSVEKVLTKAAVSHVDLVKEVGMSCAYPNALLAAVHLVARLDSSQDAYMTAVRQTILAGGDNGSRSVFIGAVQAARLGSAELLPAEWKKKTALYDQYAKEASQLSSFRL